MDRNRQFASRSMAAEFVYLAEGARGELATLAAVLEREGLDAHIGPPPADCLTPG